MTVNLDTRVIDALARHAIPEYSPTQTIAQYLIGIGEALTQVENEKDLIALEFALRTAKKAIARCELGLRLERTN